MKKPVFITDEEWNTIFPSDRDAIVSIAASLFRKGYAKRESFFLAKEVFSAQTYGKLLNQKMSHIFLKWVEMGFNPSGSEVHQTILFGKLIKAIHETTQEKSEVIKKSESPARDAWKYARWNFPEKFCVCCFAENDETSIRKSGFVIHENCGNMFSKIAFDLAERIVFEVNHAPPQQDSNNDIEDATVFSKFDDNEDLYFVQPSEAQPTENEKPFLDIFK